MTLPSVPCSSCGRLRFPTERWRRTGELICHLCRQRQPVPYGSKRPNRVCAWCGKQIPVRKTESQNLRGCSNSCGQKLRHWGSAEERRILRRAKERARDKRKRAAKRGAVSEPYTLQEIAARDGHRCGLCHKKVDMALPYQHPKAATIDHLVPLSMGGDNTKANVQLAHRRCNTRKNNRGGGEQLRLVG